MKWSASIAAISLLAVGAGPVLAGPQPCDCDGDTILDINDNCSDVNNPDQDDTDGDDCGNVCDADWGNTGIVGFADFGAFGPAFNTFDLEFDITEPVNGPVGFADFGAFGSLFNSPAGPSGTTAGTLACP